MTVMYQTLGSVAHCNRVSLIYRHQLMQLLLQGSSLPMRINTNLEAQVLSKLDPSVADAYNRVQRIVANKESSTKIVN